MKQHNLGSTGSIRYRVGTFESWVWLKRPECLCLEVSASLFIFICRNDYPNFDLLHVQNSSTLTYVPWSYDRYYGLRWQVRSSLKWDTFVSAKVDPSTDTQHPHNTSALGTDLYQLWLGSSFWLPFKISHLLCLEENTPSVLHTWTCVHTMLWS